MKRELITATIGTTFGIVGTATQTNEVLETISLVITIIGAIFSFIVVPLINWYRSAKKDGKITPDEIQEGVGIIADGLDKTQGAIKKGKPDDEREN